MPPLPVLLLLPLAQMLLPLLHYLTLSLSLLLRPQLLMLPQKEVLTPKLVGGLPVEEPLECSQVTEACNMGRWVLELQTPLHEHLSH